MSFYTAINCMDGRIQESVASYIKKKYNVLFVDMITDAGPVRMLSNKKTSNLESIISCIEISLKKHKSKGIAIVAHHDCAGNPIPDEEQKKPEVPHRMNRIAWPNAKYGLYLAIVIIIGFLLIFYKDIIF